MERPDFTTCRRIIGRAYNGANGKKIAVERIVPRINIDEIKEFIDTVPYIADMQKKFYKTYITARYEKIIVPAYEHIHDVSQNEELTMNM